MAADTSIEPGHGADSTPRVFRFGVFQVDARSGELRKHGIRIKIQDQPFQVLCLLLDRPGELVTREELRQQLWPGNTFVDFDHSLNICINKLRDALGDSADTPRYVETLPRRGYRFIYPVEALAASPPLAVESVPATGEPVSAPVGPQVGTAAQPGASWKGWAGAAVFLVVLALAAYALWQRTAAVGSGPPAKRMLAVLPFEDLTPTTGKDNQEYFIAGLTEEMISQLGRLEPNRLGVIAPASVLQYLRASKSLDQVARELQVDYVLAGSVRRAGDRVRITARLIQSKDMTSLWAENYDHDLSDIFAVQTDVARRVAASLAIDVFPAARAGLDKPATMNMEARDAYAQGRYMWNRRTLDGFRAAIGHFQRAIELDPSFARAHAGLADSYLLMGGYSFMPPSEAFPRARAAAERALELDPTLAEAHNTLAATAEAYEWDWAAAQRHYQRAFELSPNYATAHQWYARYLMRVGRFEESLKHIELAQELDPLSLIIRVHQGGIYYYARRFEQAEEVYRSVIALDPTFIQAHLALGRVLERTSRFDEAIAEFQHAQAISGADEDINLARALATAGRAADARRLVDEYIKRNQAQYVPAVQVAKVYAALGEKDRAMDWLEQAYQQRSSELADLRVDPSLDTLRDTQRFQILLANLRLPR